MLIGMLIAFYRNCVKVGGFSHSLSIPAYILNYQIGGFMMVNGTGSLLLKAKRRSLRVFVSALTLLAVGLGTAQPASAIVFYEDFESGLSSWVGKSGGPHNGAAVADPLQADTALNFTALNSAGDIFTFTNALFPSGTYTLNFDYLGLCTTGDCGGFIGFSLGLPWLHTCLGGTTSLYGYSDLLPDTLKWEPVTITFYSPASFHLMIEDWVGSGGIAGDAYFDNISLSAVPEPSTFILIGSAMAGFAAFRRFRRR